MNNRLVEQIINCLQKRLGINKKEKDVPPDERKATVIRDGNKITIIPKSNVEYIPNFVINDSDAFEKILEKYLNAVRNTNIKSTKMDERHNEKYFLFNVWKNATNSDFQKPEKFINRYTNFILDDTFSQYDDLTPLGHYEDNILMVRREQDDYGFETPYIMHLSLTDGKHIYNLPWVRYGISNNKLGEKIAYIYALQRMEPSSDEEYNQKINKILNRANKGVKKYRNVTPSAVSALAIFFGMLEKEGIKAIKAPDFLIGRYNRFANADTQEETDRIQTNLTNKFLRNFLRLSEQFDNIKVETGIGNGIDSFLCISLDKMQGCDNEFLDSLYNLGRVSKTIEKSKDLGKEL